MINNLMFNSSIDNNNIIIQHYDVNVIINLIKDNLNDENTRRNRIFLKNILNSDVRNKSKNQKIVSINSMFSKTSFITLFTSENSINTFELFEQYDDAALKKNVFIMFKHEQVLTAKVDLLKNSTLNIRIISSITTIDLLTNCCA